MPKEPDSLKELFQRSAKPTPEEDRRFEESIETFKMANPTDGPAEIINEVDPALEEKINQWRQSKEYKQELAEQTKTLRRKK